MSVSALLRFVPAYDPRIIDDPKLARSVMVQRGALETVLRDQTIPVIVDHDKARQVGTVRELSIFPDVAGGVVQDWYFAYCNLDSPPAWLKRGGGVSWAYNTLQMQEVQGTTRLLRGLIREISILSPGCQAAEPLARVVLVENVPVADRAAGRKVVEHRDAPGQSLIRPNSGYVIGVR